MALRLHGPEVGNRVNANDILHLLKLLAEEAKKDRIDETGTLPVDFSDPRIIDRGMGGEGEIAKGAVLEVREEIRAEILRLFQESLKPVTASDTAIYMPVPGYPSARVTRQDMQINVPDWLFSMLDLEDPDFEQTVADRKVGAINLLAFISQMVARHGDPRACLGILQELAAQTQGPDGKFVDLSEIPWEAEQAVSGEERKIPARKDILMERFRSAMRIDLMCQNRQLTINFLTAKKCESIKDTLQSVGDVYQGAIAGFEQRGKSINAFYITRLFNDLLLNIRERIRRTSVQEMAALGQLLKIFVADMVAASAKRPEDFDAVVKTFIAQSMPQASVTNVSTAEGEGVPTAPEKTGQ